MLSHHRKLVISSVLVHFSFLTKRLLAQVTRFQWLHEDLLETAGMNFARPRRCDVINDLNKRMATMRHLEEVMQQVQVKKSGRK